MARKVYLDWLRGVAVVVMVAAHVTDAWTRVEDRGRDLYGYTVLIAGMASPLFLFLAGLTIAMAASARSETIGHPAAANLALKRAVQVFGLAFLFRLQSQLLGWGPLVNFLKVDILNVMGIAMIAAALLWRLSTRRIVRIMLFAIATVIVAMSTPLVRESAMLAALPDAIEAYIRPLPGRTNFALFPWMGFVLGGAIAGEVVFAAKSARRERALHVALAAAGAVGISAGYAASYLPAIYPVSNFWTSSPTFFFLRLGVCTLMLPVARLVDVFHGAVRARFGERLPEGAPGRVITTLGRSSLFVYWIHVEMAYGAIALPLRRAMPIELSLAGTAALVALLYAITRWKDRWMAGRELTGAWKVVAPILK